MPRGDDHEVMPVHFDADVALRDAPATPRSRAMFFHRGRSPAPAKNIDMKIPRLGRILIASMNPEHPWPR